MAHGVSLHRKKAKIRPPENQRPEQAMAGHHTGRPCKRYGKTSIASHRLSHGLQTAALCAKPGLALREAFDYFPPASPDAWRECFLLSPAGGALPQESIAPER